MESAPKTFLFVNKTQSSRVLSRAEGAEKIHVQSHSQQARRSRENKAAVANHVWSVATHDGRVRGRAPQRKLRSVKSMSPDEHSAMKPAPSKAAGSSYRLDRQSAGNPALSKCPSRNGSDPFNCTVAGSDISHYHHIILGFISGQSPKVTFFAEAFAPGKMQHRPLPMRHDAAVTSRLQDCVRDRALMYSTLAYGANLLGWMGGVSDAFKPAEYFTGQAIQAVRERILSPSTASDGYRSKSASQLALSIYSLAISELWKVLPLMQIRGRSAVALCSTSQPRQVASTSRMHLQALLELVNSSGGWSAFDPYVLESAILADKYLACWEWTTPTIAINRLPVEYSLQIPGLDHQTAVLGSRLLAMDLDRRLNRSIKNIVDYVYFAKQAWALAPLPFDVQSGLFFQLQRLIYDLLCLADLSPVEHCVRTAALIFLQTNMLYRGAHICASILTSQLRPALLAARLWEDTFDPELRFWCLTSALLVTEPSPDDAWFNSMLVRYINNIARSDSLLDDARNCLEKYLYLDDRQGCQLASLIERLIKVIA
ncbi:hypothetical protein NLG97_g5134 [Lecanicillium saksenae]|uniref:Uncharacterized protein n=1 Tax=Lecanicillium saksenae TaxID=468837 RepID=A0ACC1QWH0_9HYPO|nr:hypothetical protein NLG97_g5134 [Lecanicillium saksenae]